MTQVELARLTGISLGTLRRLERDELADPPLRHLANCAIVLGCRLEDLIEDEWREWAELDALRTGPQARRRA